MPASKLMSPMTVLATGYITKKFSKKIRGICQVLIIECLLLDESKSCFPVC